MILPKFVLPVLLSFIVALEVPSPVVYAAGTITVDRTDDNAAASACTTAAGDCSLRGAVIFANAHHGTTIIVPSGTYHLTIDGTGESYPADPAIGDLDVEGNYTIINGAGSGSTIIQQTTLHDRVIEINPAQIADFKFTMSGVTVQGGRETTGVGGGGMISGSQGNRIILSDVVFNNNQVSGSDNPNGGGVDHSGGSFSCTNCIFTNNIAAGNGGGLYLSADTAGCVTPCAGTFTIAGSTFISNTSTTGAGGAIFDASGTLSVTQSIFLDNQVTDVNGGRGGAIGSSDGANHNVTVIFSRFVGNNAATAANGKTLYGGSGDTMIAANNWWGTNTGPEANDAAGSTTTNPWIILSNTASPNPIRLSRSTKLTADFLHNSSAPPPMAASYTRSQIKALLGLPVSWGNAQRGTLSNQQMTIQASGIATATFTAGNTSAACGPGGADATVDNGTATASVTIQCPDLMVTQTNNVSGSVVIGQSWTWTVNVVNVGDAAASFYTGQTIFTDNLPDSTNINYDNPTASNPNVNCSISIRKNLNCYASSTVTIVPTTSFTVEVTEVASAAAKYDSPREGGSCSVDPDNHVIESNEDNNTCSDTVTVNKISTTTAIRSNAPDPSVLGQAVTVVYTVTANAPGPGLPTGNVTVSDGMVSCTASVAAGQCSLTPVSAGAKNLTATYAGDSIFYGSASSPVAHTINKANTTTTISDAPDPSLVGQPVTIKYGVTVSAPGVAMPLAMATTGSMSTPLLASFSGNVIDVYANQDIQAVVNGAISGTSLYLHAGVYPGFTVTTSGLTIASAPSETAVISGPLTLWGLTSGTVANLTIQDALTPFQPGLQVVNSSGMQVTGNNIHGNSFGLLLDHVTNSTVTGNNIYDNASGLEVHYSGSGVVISQNMIHDNNRELSPGRSASGVTFYYTTGALTLTDNTVSNNQGVGIEIFAASNLTIERNVLSGGFDQIETGTDEALTPCDDLVIRRNVVHKIANGLEQHGFILRCASHSLVANNVLDGLDLFAFDFNGGAYSGSLEGLRVLNNVMVNGRAYSIDFPLPSSVVIDYNDAWTTPSSTAEYGTQLAYVFGYGPTDSWDTFRSWTGYEARGLNVDPLFVNADGRDYHLQSISPVIDQGTNVGGAYNGAAPDLGPYESGNGLPMSAPGGVVTVSDGSSFCSGTVAAGHCTLIFTQAGVKTLTATYAGDSNFNGSPSATITHTTRMPVVQFATPAYALATRPPTFMVTLEAPPFLTATVQYTTSTGLSATLTFSPTVTLQTFPLTLTIGTPVTVTLLKPRNATLGGGQTQVVVLRDLYLPLMRR